MIAVPLAIFGLCTVVLLIGIAISVSRERPFQCEVCGKLLPERKAVVLTEEFPEADGGTSMTAVFCKKDSP